MFLAFAVFGACFVAFGIAITKLLPNKLKKTRVAIVAGVTMALLVALNFGVFDVIPIPG